MNALPTPFNVYLPRTFRIDPLLRVYLGEDRISGIRIGHQFSDLDSAVIQSRAEHYDKLAINEDAEFGQAELLRITRNEIVKLTMDHTRNYHMPASPAIIRIEQTSGAVTKLLLLPKTDTTELGELLGAFYSATVVVGSPRTDATIAQSPKAALRQYLLLGSFFSVFSVGCLWYSLQQLAHLPILIAVPPNIWGAVHCFRCARAKWLSISTPGR